MVNGKRLFRVGVVGSITAAICCFTPVLSISLGLLGLGAMIKYLDSILIPGLGFFILLALIGQRLTRKANCATVMKSEKPPSGVRS